MLSARAHRGPDADGVRVLESCHSTWIFDPARRRFRRTPRGVSIDVPMTGDWTGYDRLEVDVATGVFTVVLNEEGTALLRSRLHGDPCPHCGDPDRTQEIVLEGSDA